MNAPSFAAWRNSSWHKIGQFEYLDADANLEKDIAGWPAGDHVKLAIVVCNASAITSIADMRHTNWQVGVISN